MGLCGNGAASLASGSLPARDGGQSSNRVRMVVDSPNSSSAVFQLLVQRGLVDTEGNFIWDKTPLAPGAEE